MGVNIKYYIISIAAIFISLGIGIFVGFNMNGEELYLKQQQALVESLEDRFIEFKSDQKNLEKNIRDLSIEKEKLSIFVGNIFYEVIHDKLEGLNTVIIETADHYFYDDVNETLKLSGISVPVHIKYMDKIYNVTEEQLQEINYSTGAELKKNEDLVSFVNNEIIDSFISRDINDSLKFLIDREYIQYDYDFDEFENFKMDNIVIAGSDVKDNGHRIEKLNVNLIKGLQEQQFRIIGVEKFDTEQSQIPVFKELNISTVDNIDSRMGKISLVYLLEGAQGHYGEKLTADSLAPFVVIDPSEE